MKLLGKKVSGDRFNMLFLQYITDTLLNSLRGGGYWQIDVALGRSNGVRLALEANISDLLTPSDELLINS